MYKISSTYIESFVGDVLPLWVEAEGDIRRAPIQWSVDGDSVEIHGFSGSGHCTFNYGVLLTFVKPGEATVTVKCGGEVYSCRIASRERRDFSGKKMNFYKGDFHTHSSTEHNHDAFLNRKEFLIPDYLNFIKNENLRDVGVISDHSDTTNYIDFFKGFSEYEKMKDEMNTIIYPGCENEIMYTEKDRFGRIHRRSGELVFINANNFAQTNTYGEFIWAMKDSPFAIGILAHPHIIGYSTKGVWDFRPRLNNSKEFRSLIKYVEAIGNPKKENMLHEYVYSECLDAGYRVSTTCSSDGHIPQNWDFTSYTGATIVMAPEKSREAFTDALLNLRAYACESGNIKLTYSVNGITAPCDLPLANKYHFAVKIDYFYEDKATRPIRCEVISDGGIVIKTLENVNFEDFEFDIESETARWFYLRFVDSNTKRTFSPPVFCSRPVIPYVIDDLSPIEKNGFKIYDKCGSDASALIDDDTFTEWHSESGKCELVIDAGKIRKISALGSYSPRIEAPVPPPPNVGPIQAMMKGGFALEYVISASRDGEKYDECARGIFRTFAGEEIVRFKEACEARYVKLEVLSTAGKRLGRKPYDTLPLKLCELSLFE